MLIERHRRCLALLWLEHVCLYKLLLLPSSNYYVDLLELPGSTYIFARSIRTIQKGTIIFGGEK
jgi:hypothetical protein